MKTKRIALLLALGIAPGCPAIASAANPVAQSAGARSAQASRVVAAEPFASTKELAAVAHAAALLDEWNADNSVRAKLELDAILAANPRSAGAHREYARYQIKNGYDVDTEVLDPAAIALAQRSLDQALAIAPSFAEAYVLQGHVYWLGKRQAEARVALSRAEAIGTMDPWLDLNWSEVLLDAGESAAAVSRCARVITNERANPVMKWMAESCLIEGYTHLERNDDVDAVHRAQIKRVPHEAFAYGNYAGFQLCRDQPEAAIKSATQALRLKTYPMAMGVLAAARYRIWTREVNAGRPVKAATAWEEASRLPVADPAALMAHECGDYMALQTLRALRETGRGPRVTPMLAVLAAAEEAGVADGKDKKADGIPGIFQFRVAATGRQGDDIFLNSEADYRDQRNLTIRITPKAATAFNKLHGVDLDAMLKGQYISVIGTARRTRIDFTTNGRPTGRFYYQTQVVVWDPTDVRMEVPDQRPPPPSNTAKPPIDA